eukprot:CAMPEP_0178650882 /NCGR_PEP_ID=MMETSP0698-20121128/21803_1 /TAXON_ID=265572 /ORGANISM="Extubocellulus spinifer, Strain CCMP396" /LENGTH=106 /DNA_ID=CAMNT_0020292451 /DNA_START=468 /DNA_END=788 /DNA_ORIENTATION=+
MLADESSHTDGELHEELPISPRADRQEFSFLQEFCPTLPQTFSQLFLPLQAPLPMMAPLTKPQASTALQALSPMIASSSAPTHADPALQLPVPMLASSTSSQDLSF